MKCHKFFRILAMASILSLLMVLPATPALAYDRDISLSPSSGKVGDEITITGDDFASGTETSERWARIFFAEDEADTGDNINTNVNTYEVVRSAQVGFVGDSDAGEFEASFKVPAELTDGTDDEDVTGGTYYVYVTITTTGGETTFIKAVAEFTVLAGEITIDPVKGPVGTEVEISGEDFGEREYIIVEYDGDEVEIQSGDEKTDRDGEFLDTIIIIPESTAGDYTITVIGEDSDSEVEAVFTVEPEMDISATSGIAGDSVTVSGTGFGKRSDVTIFLDNAKVATETTFRDGSFDTTFDVPAFEPGIYVLEAWDEDNNSDTVEFTIIVIPISAELSSVTGHIGTELTITGTGYTADRTATIKYDTTQAATATVKADGTFLATFKVPVSTYGDHVITISDGITTKQFIFTMESEAPPIPQPLLPEIGVKAEQPVYFDWGDATDDSLPVTYTLQVAKDKNFTTIVLGKEGLTQSEYTVTEKEKLESTKKDAPYWWRVKAIDGASTESTWSGARSFFVGFIFAMPDWALYLLFSFGALLLGVLGFWLGRRTAYSSF